MRRSYCQAVALGRGVPVLLPLLDDRSSLRRAYDAIDGLLLCGGGDVDAARYGARDTGRLVDVDPERDRVEITLTEWALEDGMPILAICRGIQLLNVAGGGTLMQDIASELRGALTHSMSDSPAHEVAVDGGSLLAQWLGEGQGIPERLSVNSRHHQAIKDVAPGFLVSARADDGVVEAIELGPRWPGPVVGVQWHPEDLVSTDEMMRRLFRRFVESFQR